MNLTYRQIEREDLEQLRDWRNQDEVRGYTREYRLLNMVNQEDWFESMSCDRNNEMYLMSITDTHFNTKIPIGVCGLCYIDWVNRNAEVSIYIGNKKRRQLETGLKMLGFLKRKAFDEYNLKRLWAEVYSFNNFNIQLFERSNFMFEGRRVGHVFKQGEYHNSLMYGLLRK